MTTDHPGVCAICSQEKATYVPTVGVELCSDCQGQQALFVRLDGHLRTLVVQQAEVRGVTMTAIVAAALRLYLVEQLGVPPDLVPTSLP